MKVLDKKFIFLGENVVIEDGAILGYDDIQSQREEYEKTVYIGDGTVVKHGTIIYAGTKIGKNCFIGNYCIIRENTVIGDGNVIGHYNQIEGNCSIGSGCTIFSQCHITSYSTLGNNIFMAPFCCLLNDPVMCFKRPNIRPKKFIGPIIKDNVRISAGVIIQPAITIGEEAVIGTGAIVTKDVVAKTIVYGSPARFVRDVSERELL